MKKGCLVLAGVVMQREELSGMRELCGHKGVFGTSEAPGCDMGIALGMEMGALWDSERRSCHWGTAMSAAEQRCHNPEGGKGYLWFAVQAIIEWR